MITIASIVEGHGEVTAFPMLARRVLADAGIHGVESPQPYRLSRGKMVKSDELGRAVRFVASRVGDRGGVVVMLDADDDCAVELAATIRDHIGAVVAVPLSVVVAVREYESLFLAGSASLNAAGHLVRPITGLEPEAKRGAEGAVAAAMPDGYKETIHQARLTAAVDLQEAHGCRWYRKLARDLVALADDGA